MEDERIGGMAGQERRHLLGQDEPPLPPVEGHAEDEDWNVGRPIFVNQRGLSIQCEGPGDHATKGGLPESELVPAGAKRENKTSRG